MQLANFLKKIGKLNDVFPCKKYMQKRRQVNQYDVIWPKFLEKQKPNER